MNTQYSFLVLIALTIISHNVIAQAPAIEWQRCYGGSDEDRFSTVKQTSDGGYIMAGYTFSDDGDLIQGNEGTDCWVVKTNSIGNIEWQLRMGGSLWENVEDIQQTIDEGFVCLINTNSADGDFSTNYGSDDIWIVKLNTNGELEWQRSLGGSMFEIGRSISLTSDGGFIIAATSSSDDFDVETNQGAVDIWIVKLNNTGDIQWQKSYGGSLSDSSNDIEVTADGGYIVAGQTMSSDGDVLGSNGNGDAWCIKLDSLGNIEWSKCYGGTVNEFFTTVRELGSNGYVFLGSTNSQDGDITNPKGLRDMWIVKTDILGVIEWERCLGGWSYEEGYDLQLTSDGGYIALGYSGFNDGDVAGNNGLMDLWVVKITSAGNIQWQKCLGGAAIDHPEGISVTNDDGCILTGATYSIDGDISEYHGSADAWIVKLSSIVNIQEVDSFTFSLYPNPATNNIIISNIERGSTITIHDIAGKLFHQSVINDVQTTIDTKQLSSGVYFVQVKNDNRVATQKLVIE